MELIIVNRDLSHVEIVRAGLTAADAGDRQACEAVMHPDLVVTIAGVPEPIKGREAWLAGVTEMADAFPDLRTEVLDSVSEGDRVAVRCRLTGTHRGTFNGLEATGREIEVMSHDIYRIESGQVVESWVLTDTAALFGQIS